MNKVILMGRLVRDPILFGGGDNKVAKFVLGIDRKYNKEESDYIECTAFSKKADFVMEHLKKAVKIIVVGRLCSNSYTNKNGQKVYSTEVYVEEIYFAESKYKNERYEEAEPRKLSSAIGDGFMTIPDGLDEELPFL